jgi:hypothetical protein
MVTMTAYENRGKTIQELCSKLAANRNEIAQLQFQLDKTFKHWSAKSMKLEKASTYWKNQCEKYQKVISAANENSQWHQKEPEIAGTKPAIEGMKKEKQPADGQYKTLYEEQLRITERQELEIDASRLAVKQLQSEKSALERHIEASNPYEGAVNDAIIALTRINAMADTKTVPQMYSGLKDIVVTKRDPNAIKKHGVAGMLNDPNDQKPDTYPFKVTHQARGNHVGKTESVVIGGARQQALPMTVPGESSRLISTSLGY